MTQRGPDSAYDKKIRVTVYADEGHAGKSHLVFAINLFISILGKRSCIIPKVLGTTNKQNYLYKLFSSMASKPITIRWIRTGS